MAKRIIRLTENDLTKLVKRIVQETKYLSSKGMDRWIDDKDSPVDPSSIEGFDTDYDEEEFDEYEPFAEKHPERTFHFDWGGKGKDIFNTYKEKYGPLRVKTRRSMD